MPVLKKDRPRHKELEVYVDDMIVKSKDRPRHIVALEKFFARIQQFRMRLNSKKVHIWGNSKEIARLHDHLKRNSGGFDKDQSHFGDVASQVRERS